MPKRLQVVVELHDVEPARLDAFAALLSQLDDLDARPRELLVIPGRLDSDRRSGELIRLLAAEIGAGSEVVMHGFDHRARGPLHGDWAEVLRGRLFAPADAEFLSLDPAAARCRLRLGRQILEAGGLDPSGFCAPGWLQPRWLPALLRETGFRYLVGMSALHDLDRQRRLWLPWTGNIGAGRLQEALVGIGGRAFTLAGGRSAVVKVFIHPDSGRAELPPGLRQTLQKLLKARRPVTYRTVLDGA